MISTFSVFSLIFLCPELCIALTLQDHIVSYISCNNNSYTKFYKRRPSSTKKYAFSGFVVVKRNPLYKK